ncbi:hypothetical protein ACVGWF_24630, partial [Enterobacter asburiae]
AIPHIGLSSLGEIVGWARPHEFPPRKMRTSKGLRALRYNAVTYTQLRAHAVSYKHIRPHETLDEISFFGFWV